MKRVPTIVTVLLSVLVSTPVLAQPITPQPEQAKETVPQLVPDLFGRRISTFDVIEVIAEQSGESDVINGVAHEYSSTHAPHNRQSEIVNPKSSISSSHAAVGENVLRGKPTRVIGA